MKERVFKVISQIMNVRINTVNENSSSSTIEEWDSLKHMNLILALEEEFGVQFTDEQIVDMVSVEKILQAIQDAGKR